MISDLLKKKIVKALHRYFGEGYKFDIVPFSGPEGTTFTLTVNDVPVFEEWTEAELAHGGLDQLHDAVQSLFKSEKIVFRRDTVCSILKSKLKATFEIVKVIDNCEEGTLEIEMTYNGKPGIRGKLGKATLQQLNKKFDESIETIIAESLFSLIIGA